MKTCRVLVLIIFCFPIFFPVYGVPPIKIAGIFEENLPYKNSATQEMLCMTQAVFHEAKINGLNFDFKVFDNKRNVTETAKVANQIRVEKFDVVIGTRNSSEALPASKILNEAEIPFIVPNSTHPDVTTKKPYVVRLVAGDKIQAKVLAEYTVKKFNPRKVISVVNVSRSYSIFLAEAYKTSLTNLAPGISFKQFEIIVMWSTKNGH